MRSLAPRLVCAAAALLASFAAGASSHRDASFITNFPKLDGTDFYLFMSYEPGRAGYVTMLANYSPFQDPWSGPNWYPLDEDGYYQVHVDGDGDGREDIVFRFKFDKRMGGQDQQGIRLSVGDQGIASPFKQNGTIAAGNVANLNEREYYEVEVIRGGARAAGSFVTDATTGSRDFEKPADFIGTKTFGSVQGYEDYARSYIYTVNVPGCDRTARLFVGQRKDPFRANLAKLFDLVNVVPLDAASFSGGIAQDRANDLLDEMNVTTFALEVHASCLKGSGNGVIGGWTTSNLPQARILNAAPTFFRPDENGGPMVQVSRVGMPLVNTWLVGYPDKNRYNAIAPSSDAADLVRYVRYPALPTILDGQLRTRVNGALGRSEGPIYVDKYPRADLEAFFLRGLKGLNQPSGTALAEMLRLDTNVAGKPAAQQNPLGALAGDRAGFPNGRRPGDDVVDVTLRVLMGRLCWPVAIEGQSASFDVACTSGNAPAGNLAFTDGVPLGASDYDERFPYFRVPIPGSAFPDGAAFTWPR